MNEPKEMKSKGKSEERNKGKSKRKGSLWIWRE